MTRLFKWLTVFFTFAGTLLLAVYIAWQAWSYLGPHKPDVSPLRKEVAGEAIGQLLGDLHGNKGSLQSLAIVHLANDNTDYLSDQIRTAVEQSGLFDVVAPPLYEKAQKLLGVVVDSSPSLNSALMTAREQGAKAVLFGRVESFESYGSAAKVEMEITLANVQSREVVFSRRYSKDVGMGLSSQSSAGRSAGSWGGSSRFFAWMVVVLLLPVFTISFIRAMVRKESNRSNAFTLAIYTSVDVLLAWLVLGGPLSGWLACVEFLLAIGVAFAYNVYIMNFALRLEK